MANPRREKITTPKLPPQADQRVCCHAARARNCSQRQRRGKLAQRLPPARLPLRLRQRAARSTRHQQRDRLSTKERTAVTSPGSSGAARPKIARQNKAAFTIERLLSAGKHNSSHPMQHSYRAERSLWCTGCRRTMRVSRWIRRGALRTDAIVRSRICNAAGGRAAASTRPGGGAGTSGLRDVLVVESVASSCRRSPL